MAQAAPQAINDAHVAAALNACEGYARASKADADLSAAVRRASVEYTRLFVGPPRPAAAPWETMYRPGSEGATVGFGQATFEMRAILREAGLEVSNKNNQYADHIGIELLLASVLCSRIAEDQRDDAARSVAIEKLVSYLDAHPRAWIGDLRDAVVKAEPAGYVANLLDLAHALLNTL